MKLILATIFLVIISGCKPESIPTEYNALIETVVGGNKLITTNEDTPISFSYIVNPDENSIDLSLKIVNQPKHGKLSSCTQEEKFNIKCIYTPAQDFHGDDKIVFGTVDGDIKSNGTSFMDIKILPSPDKPTALDKGYAIIKGEMVKVTLAGKDVDGDKLEITITSKSEDLNGNLENCQRIDKTSLQCEYTSAILGEHSIHFLVNDGINNSEKTGVVKIFVREKPSPCLGDNPPEYCSAIHRYKPALAVRGASCLMCHAKIDGNLVTDFGNGDNFFFGGHDSLEKVGMGVNPYYSKSMYNNWGSSWSTAKINGNIIIPKVKVNVNTQSFVKFYNEPIVRDPAQLIEELSLKEILTLPYMNTVKPTATPQKIINIKEAEPKTNVNFDSIGAGVYGKLIEKDEVKIKGPTEALIVSLTAPAKLLKSSHGGATSIYYHNNAKGLVENQFKIVNNSELPPETVDRYFVEIEGDFKCQGDIVILGRVHLKNVRVINQDTSCRIYTTKSVFITGAVTYQSNESNLQISSARAIIMGFQYIEARLSTLSRGTRYNDHASLLAFKNKIINDRNVINILEDDARPHTKVYRKVNGSWNIVGYNSARTLTKIFHYEDLRGFPLSLPANSAKPTEVDNEKCYYSGDIKIAKAKAESRKDTCFRTRNADDIFKEAHFKQLLVNAPVVYSRYFGQMKGIVIAEEALFSVGKLNYKYDPVFDFSAILPLIINEVFSVTEDEVVELKE